MAARASLFRTESRWGLYHLRADYPATNDDDWFCHTMLFKGAGGQMHSRKRKVAPYSVGVPEKERGAYHRLRIEPEAPPAINQ
jgi:hypothetical protein